MADHTTYTPLSPRLRMNSPPTAVNPSNHSTQHLGIASRTTSFSEDNELSSSRDWLQDRLGRIIDHPRFENLYPCINTYLQLNDHTFRSILRVREDPEARTQLEPLHSSIWHNPPEDIWVHIVHLRHGSTFSTNRLWIMAQVQNAYCQSHRLVAKLQPQPRANEPQNWDVAPSAGVEHPSTYALASTRRHLQPERNARSQRPDASQPVEVSVAPSGSNLPVASQSSQKPPARIAPPGMYYQCPSLHCTRTFVKQAHYTKHLSRYHPEYRQLYPGHVPEMALQRSDSNNTSNGRPNFNSTTSLSGLGDAMDDTAIGGPDNSADYLMPDEGGMIYIGGGMSMAGMHVDPNNAYYMGIDEN